MYEHKSTMRYRIRNRDSLLRENFLPWGLLGLLFILLPLLFALLWYAKHEIQHTVQAEVKKELISQNLGWVKVDVDGQAVTLTGQGSKVEGDRAIAIAKKVDGAAWLGRFAVPSKIEGNFSVPPETSSKPAIKPTNSEQPQKTEPSWGSLIGQLDAGVLTLTGTVGSEAEKEALLDAANAKLDPPRLTTIIDKLQVSTQPMTPASAVLAKRASDLVSICENGESSSVEGVFSIQCQAKRGQVENLKALASTPIDGAKLDLIQISSSDDCNKSFVEILDGKSIRFSIGSANLKASSAPLLERIADLAKSCPGAIRVEGHTDKSGNFDSNMALSDARAKAVVDALVELGVKSERLSPQGFGQTQPRAAGDTRTAYALNRRIEFHVSQ